MERTSGSTESVVELNKELSSAYMDYLVVAVEDGEEGSVYEYE